MTVRRPWLAVALLVLLASPAVRTWASPTDSKPGDVRATYAKAGTVLRADGAATAAPVATLVPRTSVTVLEVKLPWLHVRASVAGQPAPVEGWLRAWETVEPSALSESAPPPFMTAAAGGQVDQRDVAAASRQLDAPTEASYRASSGQLGLAYPLVDRMEADTRSLDAGEVIGFIMEGSLGQKGRDLARPARLPPEQAGGGPRGPRQAPKKSGGDGGGLGGLLKFGAKKLGVKVDDQILDGLSKLVGAVGDYAQQVSEKFTPSQEYYLGRAVAANAIARYGIDPNEARRHHVKLVGDAVVRLTDRLPANYGGYHFDVLNTDEVNGISGPGGFILLTRGAVNACSTEDELAGLLGHELGHVKAQHGEQVLRASQQQKARTKAFVDGLGGVANMADARFPAQAFEFFKGAVGEMAQNSMNHAYGAQFENEADVEGTYLLVDVVYDWVGLRDFLRRLGQDPRHAGDATHMPPESRARMLDGVVAQYPPFTPKAGVREARLARFLAAIGRAGNAPPR